MPASVETSIWLALRARVASLALSPVHTVAYPKESFPVPAGGYLRVTLMPNASSRLFLKGSDPHHRKGILQLDLMSPLNTEPTAVTVELSGQIAAHFPADLAMRHGAVTVKVEKAPDVMRGFRDEESARWFTPVSVRWECFV